MTESRGPSIVEARAALPLDGGVKCQERAQLNKFFEEQKIIFVRNYDSSNFK